MPYTIEASAHSGAGPEKVFALLADGNTWTDWGAWFRFELAVPDAEGGQGPGAERTFYSRSFGRTIASRERVVSALPGRELRYELVSGMPMKNYRARVELTPEDGGTRIAWTSTFDSAHGQGWIYQRALSRFIADTTRRLARAAEQV